MAPIPLVALDANKPVTSAEYSIDPHGSGINALSTTFSIIVVLIAALTLILAGFWFLLRTRRDVYYRHVGSGSTEYYIIESSVSIDMDEETGLGITYGDEGRRLSFETILDSASPRKAVFDSEELPVAMQERKGSLLERRGRQLLPF